MIKRIRRTAIKTAVRIPSLVMCRKPQFQSTSPLIIKMFNANVNKSSTKIGFRPRTMKDSGTLDTAMTMPSTTAAMPKPMKSLTMNSSIRKSSVAMILTRGSSLCTHELPG